MDCVYRATPLSELGSELLRYYALDSVNNALGLFDSTRICNLSSRDEVNSSLFVAGDISCG